MLSATPLLSKQPSLGLTGALSWAPQKCMSLPHPNPHTRSHPCSCCLLDSTGVGTDTTGTGSPALCSPSFSRSEPSSSHAPVGSCDLWTAIIPAPHRPFPTSTRASGCAMHRVSPLALQPKRPSAGPLAVCSSKVHGQTPQPGCPWLVEGAAVTKLRCMTSTFGRQALTVTLGPCGE